ncbi:MAG: SLBB domain-containing protein [Dermatophilaceae bacterium]
MPRRHDLDAVSVRALTYLRSARGGYVPTARELAPASADPDPTAARPVPTSADPVAAAPDGGLGRHRRHRPAAGWVQLPSALVGARWQPGRAAVLGVVLAVFAVVAVLGLRVAWAGTRSDDPISAPGDGPRAGATGVTTGAVPVGAPPPTAPVQPPPAGGPDGASARPPSTSASGVAVVHVVGQVRRPGVYRLPHGSRVSDAVAAAQGATTRADVARVNLARVLVDGEQVRVPAPGEPVDPAPGSPPGSPASGSSGTSGATTRAPVSLNSGDLAAFDTLPGVGLVLAQRILDWRGEHGRFTSVDELGEVSGIGEKVLAQLRPLVTL